METKKAIITGASRGIGKGIAFSLAAAGYDVAISYHSKAEEAVAVQKEIERKYGVRCFVFCAKLEDPGAGVKLFEEVGRPRFNGEQCRCYCFRKYF